MFEHHESDIVSFVDVHEEVSVLEIAATKAQTAIESAASAHRIASAAAERAIRAEARLLRLQKANS